MMLFPYDNVRKSQEDVIAEISRCVAEKKNLILHAPTGIGKTAAALSPCLAYGLEHGKTVFFLTARQTQHDIAIETLRDIKKKHNINFACADIIGKKGMCLQQNVSELTSNEFKDFCKSLVEGGACEFYSEARNKGKSVKAERLLGILKGDIKHVTEIIESCKKESLCPYEISSMLAEKANVIVADYYHLFNPAIRMAFLQKCNKKLEDCIIIVDEGHNLGRRCRDLLTFKLSSFMIERAVMEAEKFGCSKEKLQALQGVLEKLYLRIDEYGSECIIGKGDFVKLVGSEEDYRQMHEEFQQIGDDVKEKQRQSFIGSIGNFLESWLGDDDGVARIFSALETPKGLNCSLVYRSLDPSTITSEVMKSAHSCIIMSGTLTPTSFYKDILGVEGGEKELKSPFPKENRLNLIVPETTTKFTRRSDDEFRKIAYVCGKIVSIVPGNSAVFFPSYEVRDAVYRHLYRLTNKHLMREIQGLAKDEKAKFLEKFKSEHKNGAVLLGVAAGSFGEGIDLPGDYLKCVIVAGLPLDKPNLETKECIRYYDEKFKRGFEYGYVFPAITKCMQNAGRCIRSETDKGVIIFLDERFAWENYMKCFPKEWDMQITGLYEKRVEEFFRGQNK